MRYYCGLSLGGSGAPQRYLQRH